MPYSGYQTGNIFCTGGSAPDRQTFMYVKWKNAPEVYFLNRFESDWQYRWRKVHMADEPSNIHIHDLRYVPNQSSLTVPAGGTLAYLVE